MAVKPELIKARLKVKYPKANLSNNRIDEISARLSKLPADDADDAAVDAVLDQANDFMPFEDIARQDDALRTAKAKTENAKTPEEIAAEAKAKADAEEAKTKQEEATKGAPDWFKTFTEANDKKYEELQKKLETIETGKTLETKSNQLKELFDSNDTLKELPDAIKARAMKTINLEEDLADQVEAASKDFEGFVQAQADAQDYAGAPGKGVSDKGPSEAEVDALTDKLVNI